MKTHELPVRQWPSCSTLGTNRLRVGIDIVQVSVMAESLAEFGAHLLQRIFCPDESAYALDAPTLTAQRLAARFAAKEAAFKTFNLSEAGIGWRDIEVRKHDSGGCALVLHGRAADIAQSQGCTEIALSMSHDGDYATAIVAALAPASH